MEGKVLEMMIDLEKQINASLVMIKKLTTDCLLALGNDDPQCLQVHLANRQRYMDRIDIIRIRQAELPISPEWAFDSEPGLSAQLGQIQNCNRQLLFEIYEMNTSIKQKAQTANDCYRQALLEIRNQRVIQAYEHEAHSSSRFLDTRK